MICLLGVKQFTFSSGGKILLVKQTVGLLISV